MPSIIARNYVSMKLDGYDDIHLTGLTWEEEPYKHSYDFLRDL